MILERLGDVQQTVHPLFWYGLSCAIQTNGLWVSSGRLVVVQVNSVPRSDRITA